MMRLSQAWSSKRVRFQLTPLMDLLLIIVFAQFLDVRETSQEQTANLKSEREKLTAQISRERSELQGIRTAITRQQRALTRQRDEARAARDEAFNEVDFRLSEMQTAIKMITEYFGIEESEITRLNTDPSALTPVDRAIQQAAGLAKSEPDAVIRFLIGHAELLKRAEVWTIHAGDNKSIRLVAGDRNEAFRLESRTQAERTKEAADQLFAAYKQFDQPKGLVVILVSFDPQSVAGVYQPMIDAIPPTLERLRSDSPETRFEYTVLGSTPDPFGED